MIRTTNATLMNKSLTSFGTLIMLDLYKFDLNSIPNWYKFGSWGILGALWVASGFKGGPRIVSGPFAYTISRPDTLRNGRADV